MWLATYAMGYSCKNVLHQICVCVLLNKGTLESLDLKARLAYHFPEKQGNPRKHNWSPWSVVSQWIVQLVFQSYRLCSRTVYPQNSLFIQVQIMGGEFEITTFGMYASGLCVVAVVIYFIKLDTLNYKISYRSLGKNP